MHEHRNRGAVLTPELAERDPEAYKIKLVEALERETALGGEIWRTLVRRRQTTASVLTLDRSTWLSKSRATTGAVEIGTALMPAATRSQLLFEDTRFTGDRELVYRLMHELSHLIHPKLFGIYNYKGVTKDPDSIQFMNTLVTMRQTGKGLSALGSLEFYRQTGAANQAVEDLTELMNMFAIDPAYLNRYLHFLINPAYESTRQQFKLLTLQPEIAQELFVTIKRSFEFFLREDNER